MRSAGSGCTSICSITTGKNVWYLGFLRAQSDWNRFLWLSDSSSSSWTDWSVRDKLVPVGETGSTRKKGIILFINFSVYSKAFRLRWDQGGVCGEVWAEARTHWLFSWTVALMIQTLESQRGEAAVDVFLLNFRGKSLIWKMKFPSEAAGWNHFLTVTRLPPPLLSRFNTNTPPFLAVVSTRLYVGLFLGVSLISTNVSFAGRRRSLWWLHKSGRRKEELMKEATKIKGGGKEEDEMRRGGGVQ